MLFAISQLHTWSYAHLGEANTVFDYTAFLGTKTQALLNLGDFPCKDFSLE